MKQHRTMRRGLGLLLGLVMCLTLLTVTALAAEPATANFTTDANAALALLNAAKTEGAANSTWDSTAKKLTLKGVNFTTSASEAVILPDGAIIELEGDNTITSVSENTGTSCCIRAIGSLTIQGSGTLIVTGSEAYQISKGIYASNDMTISGTAKVTARGGTADGYSYGINANAVTISGTAKVTATGGEAAGDSNGICAYGGITISNTAEVTATGGEAGWESYGICVNNDGDITISDTAKVTAIGGTACAYSDGIFAYEGNVTISGGTVEATGGNVTGEDSESFGIESWDGDITISGGTVTATGGNVTGENSRSFGINVCDVTISDTAKVEATGGTAGTYSDGICAEYDVIISGGTVTATGGNVTGEGSESFGIESWDGEITISGGHVTARTLAGTDATKRTGLNVTPGLSDYTGYYWRTSPENAFIASKTTPYAYDTAHTYFEVNTNPFEDVSGSAYYHNAVLWAVEKGITAGTSATTFSPNAPCTRAQVVAFLWRTAGRPEPTTTSNPFTDVKASDYYYKAVLWAVENKIVYGIDETTFGPNLGCTRGQVAAFLWRAAGRPEPTTTNNPFHDVDASAYYCKAVTWAAENKIVYGITTTQFGPNVSCTRAQIVTFLYRTYGK